jgi:alpha-galactosidase
MKQAILFTALLAGSLTTFAKPLKVYILAGQSNMEGHAQIRTFEAMALDPATQPILQEIRASDGSPRVCGRVWISYYTGGRDTMGEGTGKLTAGFGSRKVPTEGGDKIGPEFTFGIYMEKASKEPILIIKTAWGGKSLHTDFRSPSAGPYPFNEKEIENLKKRGKSLDETKVARAEKTGHFYRLMVTHVKHVLGDIKRVYPDYVGQGYELAGFAWFQGWNDMVASDVYPDRGKPGGYAAYSECMAHFIRDVRKDLAAPEMKFVIGVMGTGGPLDQYVSQRYVPIHGGFREAMAAPAALPEFQGNVTAVETAPFWDMRLQAIEDKQQTLKQLAGFLKNKHKNHANKDGNMDAVAQKSYVEKRRGELISADDVAYGALARSNAAYHYYGSAKTMAQIGKAFAEAMLTMESGE